MKSYNSTGVMTDLACRGLVAVVGSSGGQRWRTGAGCWGGKPGSSRRACSPARTRQDKYTLQSGSFSLVCLKFVICSENIIVSCWWRSRGELTWICCWSRLILCCCWISCCCCLAIWDTRHVRCHTCHENRHQYTQCRRPWSGLQPEPPPSPIHRRMNESYLVSQ